MVLQKEKGQATICIDQRSDWRNELEEETVTISSPHLADSGDVTDNKNTTANISHAKL